MDKLIYVWIMVFMVSFVVFTVKSNDDTVPDSVLKTELRSITWPDMPLHSSDDDGEKSKKHVLSKTPVSEDNVTYTVCFVTYVNPAVDYGTTDNVVMKAYGENRIVWREVTVGRPSSKVGQRPCFQVPNIAMTQVEAVKIWLDGEDKWLPMYIAIYIPGVNRCYYCGANNQCDAVKIRCMVWDEKSIVVENCNERKHAYCQENMS